VNETSFKLLSSYLNVMLEDRQRPRPIEATFYIKPRVARDRCYDFLNIFAINGEKLRFLLKAKLSNGKKFL
jgi:hypothetical protein